MYLKDAPSFGDSGLSYMLNTAPIWRCRFLAPFPESAKNMESFSSKYSVHVCCKYTIWDYTETYACDHTLLNIDNIILTL